MIFFIELFLDILIIVMFYLLLVFEELLLFSNFLIFIDITIAITEGDFLICFILFDGLHFTCFLWIGNLLFHPFDYFDLMTTLDAHFPHFLPA